MKQFSCISSPVLHLLAHDNLRRIVVAEGQWVPRCRAFIVYLLYVREEFAIPLTLELCITSLLSICDACMCEQGLRAFVLSGVWLRKGAIFSLLNFSLTMTSPAANKPQCRNMAAVTR
jgi:hypothetical protein